MLDTTVKGQGHLTCFNDTDYSTHYHKVDTFAFSLILSTKIDELFVTQNLKWEAVADRSKGKTEIVHRYTLNDLYLIN